MNKLLDTRNDVKNFMIAGDQTLVGYTEQSDLYMNLITEELIHELLKEYDRKNLVGIADGIADSIVVIEGFCHSLGLDLEKIWEYVNETPTIKSEYDTKYEYCIRFILEIYVKLRSNYKEIRYHISDPKLKDIEYLAAQYQKLHSIDCASIIRLLLKLSKELNLPIQEIWDEVARSNSSKISENGKVIKNEFGKIQKGPNYFKPDIKNILLRHGLIGE